jgi:hypothetical protein
VKIGLGQQSTYDAVFYEAEMKRIMFEEKEGDNDH